MKKTTHIKCNKISPKLATSFYIIKKEKMKQYTQKYTESQIICKIPIKVNEYFQGNI